VVKVAIVGSRDFPRLELVGGKINALAVKAGGASNLTIISGGARGVDAEAERYARSIGAEVVVVPADWDGLGKSAGFIRNKEIVARAHRVVAFWDGESRGTMHTIGLALEYGRHLEVIFATTAG
jgi:predicted Rossmann fold nucleotide-binding protein DprA/Smf involved in DNA uptake